MTNDDVLILKGAEVLALLEGREREIIDTVAAAYRTHSLGDSCVPYSSFVRFPARERERIIALPAYLGGEFASAGLKWIASFPGNLERGLERASAVLVLNSTETGHLQAIMESSLVSAKRTAASAALAGDTLSGPTPVTSVGVVGCGLINFETVRFLRVLRPELDQLLVHDLDPKRARQFQQRYQIVSPGVEVRVVDDLAAVFDNAPVVAMATTAVKPHIDRLPDRHPASVVLHTSLRDLTVNAILQADNVVDDIDHVLRAETSVHLAEQKVGHRDFIRCTIGDILNGAASPRNEDRSAVVFSPFGLGVLDLAVAGVVHRHAVAQGAGTSIGDFLPPPWIDRNERQTA